MPGSVDWYKTQAIKDGAVIATGAPKPARSLQKGAKNKKSRSATPASAIVGNVFDALPDDAKTG